MSEFAIEVENLTKVFYPQTKLKETFGDLVGNLLKKKDKNECFEVKALNNVSFKVKKGEVLGIIGDNGSGKSTLLKILSGVTDPSSGLVRVHGSVLSILEIGTGFHPELSGRDNIHFMGELYGLTKKEILLNEKAIIDFSELIDFIDVPVKNYSSGMFMRLAFSIIIHLDADIILLDEVFSVGDVAFKIKCEERIELLKNKNITILLVSHDIQSIIKIATNYLLLQKGSISFYDTNINSITGYLEKSFDRNEFSKNNLHSNNSKSFITQSKDNNRYISKIEGFKNDYLVGPIIIRCYSHNSQERIYSNSDICFEIEYFQKVDSNIYPCLDFYYNNTNRFAVFNPNFSENTDMKIFNFSGKKVIKCIVPKLYFNNGLFTVSLFFTDENALSLFSFSNVLHFKVEYSQLMLEKYNYDGKYLGPSIPSLKWIGLTPC